MTNTETLSTQKIIVFIVFVCAALMASLFIYHSNQKPAQPIISPDVGIIFPSPREIKSFELISTTQQKFTEKDFYHHWTLLFFGFTHCASVCPANLDVMKQVYTQLHDKYSGLNVVLVSVDPERDTLESLTRYTQQYHPAFIGLTGKIQAIRKLQSQLGIYSARENAVGDNTSSDNSSSNPSMTNSSATNNYQIQHTASIMLIDPQGKWAGLFKFGVKPDELVKAFETAVHASWRNHA